MSDRGKHRRIGHITGKRPDVRDLPVDSDVEREIEVHIEQKVEDLIAEGWDPEAARHEAVKNFGDKDKIGAKCREISRSRDRRLQVRNVLQGLRFDFRFAVRQLIRKPVLTIVVMFTLAVGIGPNIAIFSVLKSFLLEPFPYPEPARLVQIWNSHDDYRSRSPLSSPDYFDYREQNTTLEEIGYYSTQSYNLSSDTDEPELIKGIAGTASMLHVLGVQPALGRLFTEAEEIEDRNKVVILSDTIWKRRFNGDEGIIGETVRINGDAHEVIGVMPEDFEFMSPWYSGSEFDMWTPIEILRDNSYRNWHQYLIIGRLKPGIGYRAAEADFRAIAARLAEQYPGTNANDSVWVEPFLIEVASRGIDTLVILLGIVGLILAVACANVASMLLARGAGRQTEVAIRSSLGASQKRIVGQLLTESVMLSMLGGIAGLVLAHLSLDLIRTVLPVAMQRTAGIGIDSGVLLFSLGLTALTGIVFGLTPARTTSKTDIISALREAGATPGGGKSRGRKLRRLAIAQLAVALLMTNGAILLFRSQQNIGNVPLNFDTDMVLTAEIRLGGSTYDDQGKIMFCERLTERLQTLPGVEYAAVTSKLPLQGGTNTTILVDDEVYDPSQRRPLVERSYVTTGYLDAIGLQLLDGRILERGDGDSDVWNVVVNRELAEHYWPGESAIGRRIRVDSDPSTWSATIVGVVESVRQWGLGYGPSAEIYFPYEVHPSSTAKVTLRCYGDPLEQVPALRGGVAEIDADLALSKIRTLGDLVSASVSERRTLMFLVNLFAVIAIVLSMAGIYGMMAYQVAQKTHEIGIRAALGAGRGNLLRMVFRHTLRIVVFAAVIGLLASIEFGIFFRRLIFGVSPHNPLYLLGGVLLIAVIAFLASGIPALRATRVDPIRALRAE